MLNSTIATVADVIMFYEALGKIRQSLFTGEKVFFGGGRRCLTQKIERF